MDAERWKRIEEVFNRVVESAPEDREALLAEACGGDGELRAEVAAILLADHRDPPFLDTPAAHILPGETDPLIGRTIGRYRLTQRLGDGGMGTVYLAERADDFRQVAALKLVRRGMDTDPILARFRSERQILASLDHPSIARLLDGGATEDGRPYFVMEHIDGESIDAYCEHRALGLRERIEIFITACLAVHYAHTNLVVHRDLKPSNILVSHDGRVKLLDFGLAKILDPAAHEAQGTMTRPDARALTPEYASPEQVMGEPITTATDVYSLGVILYEILTGVRPHRFRTRSYDEVARVLTESSPARPSAAAPAEATGAAGEAVAAIAPVAWRRQLRGDLDTIVMMAMQREPARRYASAEALAEDLRRYLRGFPVVAQRDSLRYRARRFVSRNRAGVAIASAFGLLLLGSTLVATLQSRRILAERREADAQREAAEQVAQLMIGLFEQSDPTVAPSGDTTTVATLIRIGEERVGALDGQPALKARLSHVFARIHATRSQYGAAQELLDEALALEREAWGRESPQVAATLHETARLVTQTKGGGAAEPLLRESLARLARLHGEDAPVVAEAKLDLATATQDSSERLRLISEALATFREQGTDSTSIASALNALATAQLSRGAVAEARSLFEETLGLLERTLPEDHPHLLAVQINLVGVLNQLGEWKAAEPRARRIVEQSRRVLGPSSLRTAGALDLLATGVANQGRPAEAESLFRESLGIYREALAADHWRIANALRNVGRCLALQERHAGAVEHIEDAAAMRAREGAAGASGAAYMRAQAALSRARLGRLDEAIAITRESMRAFEEGAGAPDRSEKADVAVWLGNLLLEDAASGVQRAGDGPGRGDATRAALIAESESLFREALERRRARLHEGHPKVAEAMCGLGEALAAQGRGADAAPLLRAALPILRGWGLADSVAVRRAAARLATL